MDIGPERMPGVKRPKEAVKSTKLWSNPLGPPLDSGPQCLDFKWY